MTADRPADEPTEADPALLRPGQRIRHRDGDEYILVERKTGSHAEPLPGWWLRQVGHEYQVGLADANWESGEWSLVDGQPTEADPLAGLEHIGDYDFGRACFWSIHEDLSPQYRRDHGMVPLYRIVDRRALVGGRSAAPTRAEALPAGVGIVRLSDCETFTLGKRTHDDDTDQDGYEVNQGGFISDEAITSGRWALAIDATTAALLSRSAAEPPEDAATIAAAAVKATAGHVYAAGYEQAIADGVAAEPAPDDDRMPTICLSCMQPIPFADYPAHRAGCQRDIAESNARLSLCECGHTAEAHSADGGACTTWRPAHERWCGCRAFVAHGVAAEPNEEAGT